MTKRCISIIIIFIIFLNLFSCISIPTKAYALSTESEGILVFDLITENDIYSKNANEKLYPASITKIMTCILTLENCDLDEIITVDKDTPYEIYGSNIALEPYEEISVRDLLYGLMLPSANDAASVLAKHISGSIDDFAKLMNEKAAELEMTNSHFVNPHGLHDKNHYTTASDMKQLVIYAMKNPIFREIVSTSHYTIKSTNKKVERKLVTTNNLLYNTSPHKIIVNGKYTSRQYEGCLGIKNGYTDYARNTLVSYVKKGDLDLIAIVMKGSGTQVYTDTHNLFDYGFKNFYRQNIIKANIYVTDLELTDVNGKKQLIPLVTKNDVAITHGQKDSEILEQNILIDDISFPVSKGDTVGKLLYKKDGKIIASTDIISTATIEKASNVKTGNKSSTISITEKTVKLSNTSSEEEVNDKSTKETIFKIIRIIIIILLLIFGVLLIIRNYNIQKRRKRKAALRKAKRQKYYDDLRKSNQNDRWI